MATFQTHIQADNILWGRKWKQQIKHREQREVERERKYK